MRTLGKALLAGTVAIGFAGACGLAFAKGPALHTMTVQIPYGGTATIQYSGNVPPKVTVGSDPFAANYFGPMSPFVALDRISAEMNHRMARLLAQPFPTVPGQPLNIDLRNMPPGFKAYSMTSTVTPNGMCMRRTEIINTGKGNPKVVSHTSGDCDHDGQASLSGRHDSSFGRHDAQNGSTLREINYRSPD